MTRVYFFGGDKFFKVGNYFYIDFILTKFS